MMTGGTPYFRKPPCVKIWKTESIAKIRRKATVAFEKDDVLTYITERKTTEDVEMAFPVVFFGFCPGQCVFVDPISTTTKS